MNHTIPNLQICIHKLDGTSSMFAQEDAGISKQILDGFQPMEVFNQQTIVLADKNSHTSFPASQITRIDLDSEQHTHLIFENGVVEAIELSKTEFETLIQNVTIRDQWKNLGEEDAFVVTFLNVEMADGQCVLLTMEVDAASPSGLGDLRDFLFSKSGLCFRMRTGGVAVLNMANLSRLTFFPGALQPPTDAWHIRLVDPKQTSAAGENLVPEIAAKPALKLQSLKSVK
jgi:hypothetical protein